LGYTIACLYGKWLLDVRDVTRFYLAKVKQQNPNRTAVVAVNYASAHV